MQNAQGTLKSGGVGVGGVGGVGRIVRTHHEVRGRVLEEVIERMCCLVNF